GRKSGVEGKRGELGGRRIIKKKKRHWKLTFRHVSVQHQRDAIMSRDLTISPCVMLLAVSLTLASSAPFPLPISSFQAEDGIRDKLVTGVQTCALPISTYSSCPSLRTSIVRAPAARTRWMQ